jgi:hypothetical protein
VTHIEQNEAIRGKMMAGKWYASNRAGVIVLPTATD